MRMLALLVLSGCASLAPFEPYYAHWNPPSIASLSSDREDGNIGGSTLTIEGEGFGDDPNQLVVQFGDDNATILAVEDTLVTVQVPPGPISGGAVDVRIATATGSATAEAAYTYDVGDLYAEQVGHVQVNNFWESCYGGLSGRLDDEYGSTGCTDFAYIGYTGIDGVAEKLDFVYPRLHAENIGFFGGTDQAGTDWVVERPGQGGFVFGVDDLHEDIGEVVLTNDLWDGDYYCPDLDSLASYRYGGGVEGYLDPVSVAGADVVSGSSCDEGDEGARAVNELRFCTQPTEDGVEDYVYRPDWPIPKNFFAGKKNDWTVPGEITFSAPESGIDGLALDVPESLVVYATEGMEPLTEDQTAAEDLWALSTYQGCFDESGDGETLDDVAVSFSWAPSDVSKDGDGSYDCQEPGDLCQQSTYVRLTLTVLSLNWFGGVGYPIRATIVVPDRNEYDNSTKLSHLEIPASVLYQIPSVRLPQAGGLAGDGLLDPTISNWGYVVTTFERVTDYSILTDNTHTLVFSYTTGDFGFFGWDNPTEADACHNCLDDDGDGWSDADDPDCAGGTEESGEGDDACNDGIDNDGDGRADSRDADCEDGADSDESNCDNGVDDDEDGLEDGDDPECVLGGYESNACDDGIDGDGDGWTDLDDPDCETGSDEEAGYGTDVCNDGLDNDADGTVDASDPECESATDADEAQ